MKSWKVDEIAATKSASTCFLLSFLLCSAALFESRIRQCTTFYRHHRAKPLLMIVLPCSLITQYVCFIND
eukprot:UN10341